MKVVVDTNVMLVSPFTLAPTYPLFKAFMADELQLCVTNEIVFEYEEVFLNKLGPAFTSKYLALIFKWQNTNYVNPYYRWNLITVDPDDNKFVDCAIAAGADYIITEDKHFNILSNIEFPKIQVISSSDFISQYLNK